MWDQFTKKLNRLFFRFLFFLFPFCKKPLPINPKRILIFSPTGIGDSLFDSAAVKSLREGFPQAELLLCAHHRRTAIAQHNPYLDKVIPLSKSPLIQAQLLWCCWRNPVDMAVAFYINEEVVPLGYLICRDCFVAAQERTAPFSFLVSHLVETASEPHLVGKSLKIAHAAGGAITNSAMIYQVTPQEKEALWKKYPSLKETSYIVVQTGGGQTMGWRNWPPECYITLLNWFQNSYPEIAIVLTGGADNKKAASQIASSIPNVLNLATKTTLEETAALLAGARMLLSTDTGVMHLGFAIGTPTVALIHYRVPAALCGPLDLSPGHQVIELEPSPQDDPKNPSYDEMGRIPMGKVKEAIITILSSRKGGA